MTSEGWPSYLLASMARLRGVATRHFDREGLRHAVRVEVEDHLPGPRASATHAMADGERCSCVLLERAYTRPWARSHSRFARPSAILYQIS
jgi:hypothetical protein